MSLFGMAAGAGAALLGNIAGGILGKAASSAMDLKASKELIKAQLDANKDLFEYENKNKHQFEVGDLRAAGLNPILSATNGNAIGVGGVSAPNWSSDDDVFGPASARAMQLEQLKIQDKQAQAAFLNSIANLHNARTGGDRNSAEALYFDEKAETERQTRKAQVDKLISDTVKNTSEGKRAMADVGRIVSEIPVNQEKAKNIAEDSTGKKLRNEQILEMNEILKDPKYDKDAFKAALAYALATGKNWTDALAFAISKSAVDETHNVKLPKQNANSAVSVYDNYDSLFEYGGVRE